MPFDSFQNQIIFVFAGTYRAGMPYIDDELSVTETE